MFIYQTKVNQKDALVTVSETMDEGKQLPITNGTVSALYEDNGTLTFGEVEISGGGEQEESYFYYPDFESKKFEKLNTPYNLPEADFVGSDSGYWHLSLPYGEDSTTPVCVEKDTTCTCKSATGYDLSVTFEDIPTTNYKTVCVGISDAPDDFYNKTVKSGNKDIPAVDITLSTGSAIFTCTIALFPMM